MPIAYWISQKLLDLFELSPITTQSKACIGMRTGDNERFLRVWFEVDIKKLLFGAESQEVALVNGKKWIPYNKGGEYRKWYGNQEYIVNWEDNGLEIKENTRKVYPQLGDNLGWKISNEAYYYMEHICWTDITTKGLSFRYFPKGFIFDASANVVFTSKEEFYDVLAYLNSKMINALAQLLNPTLHFKLGNYNSLPMLKKSSSDKAGKIAQNNILLSKTDWDSFETSWDFKRHPLLSVIPRNSALFDDTDNIDLAECYTCWENECNERFNHLKTNEEELNRIFIDIYGLQDELSPEVEDKDVTVRKADLQRDIKSLISYAVGCMFGRYSLNEEGLVYAGGEWDDSKYTTFIPDADNIIPITDEEYLEDDIVSRFCTWLKTAFGAKSLETNLDFIAKALGNKGDTSREIIRNYFLNDFFKDHCNIYSVTGSGKRPIYWLFDSGKQNGFKALVYLHRYNADTIGNVRVDYLYRMQRVYESEIGRMQDTIDNSKNNREVSLATKRKEKLQKQLKECREYDEKIGHLALARIELDLDDGVKANYRKVQTASDGKFYEILADSKNIMTKK